MSKYFSNFYKLHLQYNDRKTFFSRQVDICNFYKFQYKYYKYYRINY